MSDKLIGRISRLESKLPVRVNPPRVVRILAGQGQEAEAERLALAEGFDPKHGDIVITRLIVAPPGQPCRHISPTIISRSAHHVR